jgi:anti-sigma B factor antagonist
MRAGTDDPMGDRDELLVASLAGDIDPSNAKQLGDQLAAYCTRANTVVLDCSAVTFMDCSGLRCLLEPRILAAAPNSSLILAAVPGPMSRLLHLAEVEDSTAGPPAAASRASAPPRPRPGSARRYRQRRPAAGLGHAWPGVWSTRPCVSAWSYPRSTSTS